jgi:hypothetical protein
VDAIDVFSLFDFGRDKFSLAYLDGAALKPKSSFEATRVAARVFSRLKDVDYEQRGEVHKVIVDRSDGLKLWVIWSSAEGGELRVERPNRAEVFGALGNRLDEGDEIVLTPRPHAALAGTVKYVVSR